MCRVITQSGISSPPKASLIYHVLYELRFQNIVADCIHCRIITLGIARSSRNMSKSFLQCNDLFDHPEAAPRASAIIEIANNNLPGFSIYEIVDSLADIACY